MINIIESFEKCLSANDIIPLTILLSVLSGFIFLTIIGGSYLTEKLQSQNDVVPKPMPSFWRYFVSMIKVNAEATDFDKVCTLFRVTFKLIGIVIGAVLLLWIVSALIPFFTSLLTVKLLLFIIIILLILVFLK